MGRPAEYTKEYLQKVGIVDISRDGKTIINKAGLVVTQHPSTKRTRYGEKTYLLFQIYDPDIRKAQLANGADKSNTSLGQSSLVVSRAVYAWYSKDHRAPANMDVHHKDDNPFNNDFDNLELLTRKENLAKRKGHLNQYESSLRR